MWQFFLTKCLLCTKIRECPVVISHVLFASGILGVNLVWINSSTMAQIQTFSEYSSGITSAGLLMVQLDTDMWHRTQHYVWLTLVNTITTVMITYSALTMTSSGNIQSYSLYREGSVYTILVLSYLSGNNFKQVCKTYVNFFYQCYYAFSWIKMPQSGLGSMQGSTGGHLPMKVVFHQRSSSTNGRLPPKIISHLP